MKIELIDIGKRFQYRYIFRHLSYSFEEGGMYYIQGSNGSGKSTLLQMVAGILSPNEGTIRYSEQGRSIDRAEIALRLSMAAPYLELVEEMTLTEIVHLHFRLREPIQPDYKKLIQEELAYDPEKQIRTYSSGMKQKLKLILAILTKSDLLLLDEPTANFDNQNILWYRDFLQKFRVGRTTLIGSPQEADWVMCQAGLNVEDYR